MKFLPKRLHAFKQRRVIRDKVRISRSGGAKRPRFDLQLSDLCDCGVSKLKEQIPESVYPLRELFYGERIVWHPGSLSPSELRKTIEETYEWTRVSVTPESHWPI
jgi:hypothetical protein